MEWFVMKDRKKLEAVVLAQLVIFVLLPMQLELFVHQDIIVQIGEIHIHFYVLVVLLICILDRKTAQSVLLVGIVLWKECLCLCFVPQG